MKGLRSEVMKRLHQMAWSTMGWLLIATNSTGQAGPDWMTVKDRTGTCQISVPKNWGNRSPWSKATGEF